MKTKAKKVVAPKMTTEQIKVEISDLKLERSHSFLESLAVSILSLLLFIGAPSVFPEIINPYLPSSLRIMQAFILVPTVFFTVALLSNMVRYYKILKLQEKL